MKEEQDYTCTEQEGKDYDAAQDAAAKEMEQQQHQADANHQEANEKLEEISEIEGIRFNMVEKLKELDKKRKTIEAISEKLKPQREKLEEEWKRDHGVEMQALNKNREDQADIETELRSLALADYAISKEKKLTGGLGIRMIKSLEYDPKAAFKWATEHKLCLSLNRTAFEKVAKTQPDDFDFVVIDDKPTATLPKKIKLEAD